MYVVVYMHIIYDREYVYMYIAVCMHVACSACTSTALADAARLYLY